MFFFDNAFGVEEVVAYFYDSSKRINIFLDPWGW